MNAHTVTNILLFIIACCLLVIATGKDVLFSKAHAQSGMSYTVIHGCFKKFGSSNCTPTPILVDENGGLIISARK